MIKIICPIDIGDPVILLKKIECDAIHYRYEMKCTMFKYSMLPDWRNGLVFTKYNEAKEKIDILNNDYLKRKDQVLKENYGELNVE